jgi:hypothetical protein
MDAPWVRGSGAATRLLSQPPAAVQQIDDGWVEQQMGRVQGEKINIGGNGK